MANRTIFWSRSRLSCPQYRRGGSTVNSKEELRNILQSVSAGSRLDQWDHVGSNGLARSRSWTLELRTMLITYKVRIVDNPNQMFRYQCQRFNRTSEASRHIDTIGRQKATTSSVNTRQQSLLEKDGMAIWISDANIRHNEPHLTLPKLVPSNISCVPTSRLPKSINTQKTK